MRLSRASSRASASRVDAVRLQLDRVQRRAALAQRQQRAVIRRALDDDVVARAHEVLEQERVGLHRAVRDEHALGLDAVAVGDPSAQARVADRRAVGGRAGRVALERAHGRVAQPLDVDDVERRRAAREGDRRSSRSWHSRVGYASEQLVVVMGQLVRRALEPIAEAQQLRGARRAVRGGGGRRTARPARRTGVDASPPARSGGTWSLARRPPGGAALGGCAGGRREGRWRSSRRAGARWGAAAASLSAGRARRSLRVGPACGRASGCALALAVEGLVDEPARTAGSANGPLRRGGVAAAPAVCGPRRPRPRRRR